MKIINKGSLKLFCLVAILAIALPAHAKKDKHKSGHKKMRAWEVEHEILHQRIDDIKLTPGLAGPQGTDGPIGPAGSMGPDGPMGPAGPIGPGPAGSMGPDGPMGPVGSMGPDGPTGPAGSMGPDGPTGPAGSMGHDGPMGPAGPIGLPGLTGANGTDGVKGSVGPTGTKGVDGDPGIDGLNGLPGKDAPDRTAELCALYNELSRQSLLGALAVPDFCTGSDNPTSTYTIGSTGPGGGIVFYVTEGGLHGLEAAPEDQSAGAQWGCYGALVTGADDKAIGTGAQNTADILAAGCIEHPNQPGPGEIAAQIADAYVSFNSNGDSYGDWFLPSVEELNQLFINKDLVGGFPAPPVPGNSVPLSEYWSSSEGSNKTANYKNLINGRQLLLDKFNVFRVRAIRVF